MTYFNTTHETENQVDLFTKLNEGQDQRVLEIVKEMGVFSASKVWQKYIHLYLKQATPITSIRRSINTLKKCGYIQETGNKVKGLYSRNELEYKI